MTPSLRSHPNHPQQPVSLPYTRFVRGNGCGSCHWLRHSLAGSPLLQTESGSLSFGTASPPRAAPHPVSRRRSCLRLLSRCSSRDDSDFHWLISYMCVRTSGVSMSAGGGGSDSAVIDSRYRTRAAARYSCSFGIFVVQGHPGRIGARRGSLIDVAAARVSFTVETTILPSFALPRGACSGAGLDFDRELVSKNNPLLTTGHPS